MQTSVEGEVAFEQYALFTEQSLPGTKKCSACKKVKPLSSFNHKVKAKGVRQSRCRECQKSYQREHYKSNPEPQKNRTRKYKKKARTESKVLIAQHKATHPCVDCGQKRPNLLEFDHIEPVGSKHPRIPHLLADPKKLAREMLLCEMRCKRCHAIRTSGQRCDLRWRHGTDLLLMCCTCKETKQVSNFRIVGQKVQEINECLECYERRTLEYVLSEKGDMAFRKKKAWFVAQRNGEAYIIQHLKSNPCVDCDEKDIRILEFDHIELRSDEDVTVSSLIRSFGRLKREIAKCQIRCALCHKMRTDIQLNRL